MASNYLVNVPKLKGRDNYNEWTFAAENFLILEDMLHCIKPVAGKKLEAADDTRTKAKLIMTIDSALYVHIKNVNTTLELWNKLKALFDDSGFTRRISLLRNLISIRLESCVSMQSYVTQIVETGQKLSGTGFNISDEWIGCLMLAGLSEKFMPMIMAIEHSGIEITTDAIRTKLMDMETEVSGNSQLTESNSAFVSSAQKWQHKKNNSLSMAKAQTVSATKQNVNVNKSHIKCYRCKQTGHYKNQCPNNNNFNMNARESHRKQTNAFSAVFLSHRFNKYDWYIDSGASMHLVANEEWIENIKQHEKKDICVASGERLQILCSGDVTIITKTDQCEFEVPVKDVLCVPGLTTNLLSVSQLIKSGNNVQFTSDGCEVYNVNHELVATAVLINGVYKLRVPDSIVVNFTVPGSTWHRRLGHVNSKYLNKMTSAVEGMNLKEKVDLDKSSCTICCEGKQCRLPFTKEGSRSKELLQLIHTDICGPMEHESLAGSRYFILFIDDYSRMTFVYFIKHKNEALRCFAEFKAKVEKQTNKNILTLRSDNGCEYCNKEFDSYLKKEGITHQKSNPYTPEQNGLSERNNRTIVEKARCLLFDANMDKEFWAEATNTAVYLQNRTALPALNDRTPFEIWTGHKPDISHLRIFGSSVMVHLAKEKRQKWDRKSEKHILVGYPDDTKGYRIYNPRTKRVTTSRDVIVMEDEKSPDVNIPISERGETSDSVGDTNDEDTSSEEQTLMEETSSNSDDTYIPSDYEDAHDSPEKRVRSVRIRTKPEWYGMSNICTPEEVFDDASGLSLEEALQGAEKNQWLLAVKEELQCFKDNNAWELVDMPTDNKTVVKCKWVLRKKLDNDNKVRYRARLVAKGYMQKKNVDYSDTFSPVVRHSTLRLLFALSVKLNLDVTHLDVTTAFLNGDLDETIYMQPPECLLDAQTNNKVLKLNRAIYGLKQSSRAWYKKVDDCLVNIGYKRSRLEPCLYTKNIGDKKTIVTLYVDDFFVFSNDDVECNNLKKVLASKFKIKDLGQVKNCLGMTVNIDKVNEVVTLSQENYINQLLNRFNMAECNVADTPLEPKLNINLDNKDCQDLPYQQLIGGLMYLAVLTRPDIAFSVSFLSQFNNCYCNETWAYAKRILKYLKKTKHFGLKYSKSGNSKLLGFVDSDWGNNILDRRSYTGLCFMLAGSVISWEAKKQKTVALSSTEAEYMGVAEACREAVYLINLYKEIIGEVYTICLYNDNQGAIKLSSSCNNFNKRSKHIDIRYHFSRECVNNGVVELKYLETANMPADLLTKGLGNVKHYHFMQLLGIQDVKN